MKKFSAFILFCLLSLTVLQAQDGPRMTFEVTEIDYGTIEKGADSLRVFKFKNTGNAPLRIFSAQGSCGCTIPKYPDTDIQPGETAQIDVYYDTQRTGYFEKTVTISNNEKGVKYRVLTIRGTVKDPNPPTITPGGNPPGASSTGG